MSYQDYLDWLARNVHAWPGGDHQPWCYVYWKSGERAVSGNCITVIEPCVKIDKIDWLARRAELQSKPDWSDAPEWALYLAQNCIGLWTFTRFEPRPNPAGGWSLDRDVRGPENRLCVNIKDEVGGEVLGDWRDTLERRPDMHKTTAEIDTPEERVQETEKSMGVDIEDALELAFWEFDAARGNSGEERICFKNKARWLLAKYGVRDELEHNDDWHERGELPPVGARLQWRPGSAGQWEHDSWIDVDVIAHAGDGDIVIKWDGQAGSNKQLVTASKETFRPIRTERDEAIEAMKVHCPYPGSWETTYRLFAEALYDAGYRAGGFE